MFLREGKMLNLCYLFLANLLNLNCKWQQPTKRTIVVIYGMLFIIDMIFFTFKCGYEYWGTVFQVAEQVFDQSEGRWINQSCPCVSRQYSWAR